MWLDLVRLVFEVPELLAELQRRRDQIARLEERLAAARRTPEKLARLMADIEARARAKLDDI